MFTVKPITAAQKVVETHRRNARPVPNSENIPIIPPSLEIHMLDLPHIRSVLTQARQGKGVLTRVIGNEEEYRLLPCIDCGEIRAVKTSSAINNHVTRCSELKETFCGDISDDSTWESSGWIAPRILKDKAESSNSFWATAGESSSKVGIPNELQHERDILDKELEEEGTPSESDSKSSDSSSSSKSSPDTSPSSSVVEDSPTDENEDNYCSAYDNPTDYNNDADAEASVQNLCANWTESIGSEARESDSAELNSNPSDYPVKVRTGNEEIQVIINSLGDEGVLGTRWENEEEGKEDTNLVSESNLAAENQEVDSESNLSSRIPAEILEVDVTDIFSKEELTDFEKTEINSIDTEDAFPSTKFNIGEVKLVKSEIFKFVEAMKRKFRNSSGPAVQDPEFELAVSLFGNQGNYLEEVCLSWKINQLQSTTSKTNRQSILFFSSGTDLIRDKPNGCGEFAVRFQFPEKIPSTMPSSKERTLSPYGVGIKASMRKAMRARSKLADLLPSYAIQTMKLKPEAVYALLKELLGTIPDCIRVGTEEEVKDGSG